MTKARIDSLESIDHMLAQPLESVVDVMRSLDRRELQRKSDRGDRVSDHIYRVWIPLLRQAGARGTARPFGRIQCEAKAIYAAHSFSSTFECCFISGRHQLTPGLSVRVIGQFTHSSPGLLSGDMAAIGSLVFCTDCGNLLDGSTGDKKAILICEVCGTHNKGQGSLCFQMHFH